MNKMKTWGGDVLGAFLRGIDCTSGPPYVTASGGQYPSLWACHGLLWYLRAVAD